MFNIVLHQPEIPPNTGNIMRLSVNTNSKLHIIEPCSFQLNDKNLKRAGMDYIHRTCYSTYLDFNSYSDSIPNKTRIFLCTTKASTVYSDIKFMPGDSLVFGPETRGLSSDILDAYPSEQKIIVPMHSNGRSLNLATAVAIVLYEAWRQQNFK